jgi:hypothetical protein
MHNRYLDYFAAGSRTALTVDTGTATEYGVGPRYSLNEQASFRNRRRPSNKLFLSGLREAQGE